MELDANDDVDLDEPKNLKVTIPARLHLQLHTRKILTGTTISQTVEDALLAFFDADGSQDAGRAG